jgi:PAS domain S-box-containing protein
MKSKIKEFLQKALESSEIWIILVSSEFKVLYASPSVYNTLGYKKEEFIDESLLSFFPEVFREKLSFTLKQALDKKKSISEILTLKKKGGDLVYLKQTLTPLTFDGENYLLSVGIDIAKFNEAEEKLKLTYFWDPVLEVYNYFGFKEKASEFLKQGFQVIGEIHIQNFKSLAESFGFYIANKMTEKVLEKLKTFFKDKEILIGRKFHDVLVFLLPLENKEEKEVIFSTLEICHRLIKTLSQNIHIETITLKAEPCLGVAIHPIHGKEVEELLTKAEKALFVLQKEGMQNRYLIYNPQIEEKEKIERKTFDLISKAISKNRFVFYFQPYFYTDSLKLAGVEVLTRIIDKTGKIIYPSIFIKQLEKSPLMQDFNEWMFNEIERIFLKIQKFKKKTLSISINLAPNEFFKDSFWELFLKFLKKGLVSNLIIEITERVFIENFDFLSHLLKMLKKVSPEIKIAIDDFGAGATSFRSILSFPIDIVKIDLLYVQKMLKDPKIACMVKSIVNICKNFNILTVAEGIETEAEYLKIKELGCSLVQGFFFEHPLSEEEFFKKYF